MEWLNEAFVCIRNDLTEFAEQLQEDSAELSRQLEETFFNEDWESEQKESEKQTSDPSLSCSQATTSASPTREILSSVNSTDNKSVSVDNSTTVTVFENYVITSSVERSNSAAEQTDTVTSSKSEQVEDDGSIDVAPSVKPCEGDVHGPNMSSSSVWDELEASSINDEDWEVV